MRRPSFLRHAIDVGADVVEPVHVVAHGAADAGRRAVFAERLAQRPAPFAGGDAGLGAGDRGRHDVAVLLRRGAELLERGGDRLGVAGRPPRLETLDLLGLDFRRHRQDRAFAGRQRRDFGRRELVDADHDLLAALDRLQPRGVGFHQPLLHVARFDRRDRAAHLVDAGQLLLRLALELIDLGGDLGRAVENVAVFQEIGLVGEDLLHAQRPLLVPRPRQAERLVPGRKLHRARARVLRQRHRQHLEQDAVDVVLRLLLGQAERVHLHAVAEAAVLLARHAVALAGDLVPQLGEGAHLAQLGDEAQARIDEERDAPDHLLEGAALDLARRLHGVEHGHRGRQRKGEFLHRRRARLLQVVGAHVHRVPFRHLAAREQDHVLDQPHRGRGREHVGAARQIFLDDVVLDGALERRARRALLVGDRDVERHQPRRGGVDGHRGVHGGERNAGKQRPHVAEMVDRHADLADLAGRQGMIGVVAGLGRQIEGDREAGLALREVRAIEPVRIGRGRMARIGADEPGWVALDGHRAFLPASVARFLSQRSINPYHAPGVCKIPFCRGRLFG